MRSDALPQSQYDPDSGMRTWVPGFTVWSPDGVGFEVSRETFLAGARARWEPHLEVAELIEVAPSDLYLTVGPADQRLYLSRARDGRSIGIEDAPTLTRVAEAAAWVRSLLPTEVPGRIWVIHDQLVRHAELPAGVTAEQVAAGWQEHPDATTDLWEEPLVPPIRT